MRKFAEKYFGAIDFVIALLGAASLLIWARAYNGEAQMYRLLNGNRTAVYAAVGRLFGTLFGFALPAISIALTNSQSEKLALLRKSKQWATLWRVFIGALRVFALVALLALGGIIFDRDDQPHPSFTYVIAFFVLLGLMRLYRILWAFERLIAVLVHPEVSPEPGPPTTTPPSVLARR
jgi:hypothetical protein